MEAKTPQNHSNLHHIDIPGKNDLEILENLKTIIKSNQHDLYKPIPQPEALLSQYHGPLPHTSDRTPHDGSPPRARRLSAFDTPPQQNPTSSGPGSSAETGPQPMNDSRRASLVHDLPARPGQQHRQEPSPSTNGLVQPRNVAEMRRNEVLPGNRQADNHYTPPQSSAQEHYPRDREERSSYERPREAHIRDDRERSPGVWDARRPPPADFRERRDDRRTFQPRPPPEDRHYEPSPERSAALEAARRPPDELERGRYADSFYTSRDRRPSDAGGRIRPEDRSYRPLDDNSRSSSTYPAHANEPYTPPSNRDPPPPRSASAYDRDPITPATRSLDKPMSHPAPPSLEARLNPPPARPSLQDRIGPPSTPNTAVSPFTQNPNNAGSKPAPSLEQRLAMPPPSSAARPVVPQHSPSVSTSSASSTLRPSYSGTHYSPSSARDPPSTGQEHRSSGERLPERYNRSPLPREMTAPRPASAQPITAREDSRNIAIKREPSPHGASANSATFRGSTYRPGENDSRTHNGTVPSARREVADGDRYESAAPSASHSKTQHLGDSRDADRSARYSQPPAARNSPAPPNSSTALPSTSNSNFAERRSLALSREMQDALYKPPQHFTPMPNKDADRRRETYPADDSHRPKPTLTERDREASAPRSSYPPIDERERMPLYREAPPRAVYESQASRPLSARLADPYPIDERDRLYHPPSSAGLPPSDARDYERSRYPAARPLDPLPPPSQAMYPPSTRVRQRSPSPIMDSRRGGVDMRAPPMKRPRDDLYSSQQQGPPPSSSGSSYYPPPPQRDYRDGASSYYPVDSGRDLRPREADYAYDTRGRAGDGYAPRYMEDDRDRRYMPPPRTS